MIDQILVPLDGSAFGEQSLPLALALARRTDATIWLVKVHVPVPVPARGSVYFDHEADRAAYEHEGAYLQRAKESLPPGVRVETAVVSGEVVAALEAFVREHQVSLVIMTTHGRGGLSRVWFGSVADALVRRVDVPVLMVRPQAGLEDSSALTSFHHILVPLDGSLVAEEAIAQATRLGTLFDARYTLLRVVAPSNGLSGDASSAALSLYDGEVEQLRRNACEYLHRMAAPLRERWLQVDTAVVLQSQAAASILEEAAYRQADLIVMGSHGRGGWRRFALGSVADKVLRGASVPVLMFRAEAAAYCAAS